MNVERLTNKSREAIERARTESVSYSASAVTDAHLLIALLADSEGLVPSLVDAMGSDAGRLLSEAREIAGAMPRVSGAGYSTENIYLTRESDAVLSAAERIMSEMGDEYISVEHIFLSSIENSSVQIKSLYKKYDITKDKVSKMFEQLSK